VGQIAGIDLRLHATVLLLLGWVGASYWMASKSMAAMLAGVVFIIALFACVVFHEMGHAQAARKFGIQTRDITLLPIGGLARLERMPEEPKQELWIALAGPAVNVAIAAILYAWLILAHQWEPLSQLRISTGPFVERLLVANISLVLFNLIPAFPMDGGRVLRALLACRMTYLKATQTAAWVAQGLAFVFGFIGLGEPGRITSMDLFETWLGNSRHQAAFFLRFELGARSVCLTQ
jgi:Zn-dependent protease